MAPGIAATSTAKAANSVQFRNAVTAAKASCDVITAATFQRPERVEPSGGHTDRFSTKIVETTADDAIAAWHRCLGHLRLQDVVVRRAGAVRQEGSPAIEQDSLSSFPKAGPVADNLPYQSVRHFKDQYADLAIQRFKGNRNECGCRCAEQAVFLIGSKGEPVLVGPFGSLFEDPAETAPLPAFVPKVDGEVSFLLSE